MRDGAEINGTIRPCPHCGKLTERIAGCAHIANCGECHNPWHFNYGTIEAYRAMHNAWTLGNADVRDEERFLASIDGGIPIATEPSEHEFENRRRHYELDDGVRPHY